MFWIISEYRKQHHKRTDKEREADTEIFNCSRGDYYSQFFLLVSETGIY